MRAERNIAEGAKSTSSKTSASSNALADTIFQGLRAGVKRFNKLVIGYLNIKTGLV